MKKMLVILLLASASGIFANPIAILFLNEVQIKPIPMFEIYVQNTGSLPTSYPIDFTNWTVSSSSGQLFMNNFTLTAADSIKTITDAEVYGNFSLNDSLDSLYLRDELGYYRDGVRWPDFFTPPDSGTSAQLIKTHHIDQNGNEWDEFSWVTDCVPTFGESNTGVSGVSESNESKSDIKPTLLLNIFPNPSKGETILSFMAAKGQSYDLKVYDLAGRLVNNIEEGIGDGRYTTAIWMGTNMEGRMVSTGNYFVVLHSEGRKTSRKITRFK